MPLRNTSTALLGAVLFTVVGCGPNMSSTGFAQTPSSQPDRCRLLTDAEVAEAIGPHRPGSIDLNNEWGLQSCRWMASTAQKIEGFPNWFDLIEVALFNKEIDPWARQQAKGEPVDGFVKGALYDSTYGELWFNCAHDRFCVVKVHTASAKNRDQIARRLAELVEKRLR